MFIIENHVLSFDLFKLFGIILMTDGLLSLFLPVDKHIFWQIGRLIRIGIGGCIFVL